MKMGTSGLPRASSRMPDGALKHHGGSSTREARCSIARSRFAHSRICSSSETDGGQAHASEGGPARAVTAERWTNLRTQYLTARSNCAQRANDVRHDGSPIADPPLTKEANARIPRRPLTLDTPAPIGRERQHQQHG